MRPRWQSNQRYLRCRGQGQRAIGARRVGRQGERSSEATVAGVLPQEEAVQAPAAEFKAEGAEPEDWRLAELPALEDVPLSEDCRSCCSASTPCQAVRLFGALGRAHLQDTESSSGSPPESARCDTAQGGRSRISWLLCQIADSGWGAAHAKASRLQAERRAALDAAGGQRPDLESQLDDPAEHAAVRARQRPVAAHVEHSEAVNHSLRAKQFLGLILAIPATDGRHVATQRPTKAERGARPRSLLSEPRSAQAGAGGKRDGEPDEAG